jgi:putative endonuclease
MRPVSHVVGRLGERLAEEHLLEQGAQLLERNYRINYGEVDLLFRHEDELVAVEVKTRDVEDLEQPEEAVRWDQLRRIARAMATYATDEDLLDIPWRIDVVVVVIQSDGSMLRLDHLRSVYPG